MELDGYRGFELIGSGGNAHVYRAHDKANDRVVAIKVIRGSGDAAVARRFERERKLMGQLSGVEGIVPIYDSGLTPAGDPYLVMPYYEAGSLHQRIREGGIPWSEAAAIGAVMADALAAAHEQSVLHLDVKPANVLLDTEGSPWLSDFGIAEVIGSTVSMSASMVTPAFTPPERFRNEKPTVKTDIYALGALLFALAAGVPPFGGMNSETNPAAIMHAILNNPVPLDLLPSDAPGSFRNTILRCLEKDPAERAPSAAAVSAMLRTAIADEAVATQLAADPTVQRDDLDDTIVLPGRAFNIENSPDETKSSQTVPALALFAILCLLGFFIWWPAFLLALPAAAGVVFRFTK